MPSKTEWQKRFMTIIAKSKEFAKKVGIPQKVGKEFHDADKALEKERKDKKE